MPIHTSTRDSAFGKFVKCYYDYETLMFTFKLKKFQTIAVIFLLIFDLNYEVYWVHTTNFISL